MFAKGESAKWRRAEGTIMPIELLVTLGAVGAVILTLVEMERNGEARRKIRVRASQKRTRR